MTDRQDRDPPARTRLVRLRELVAEAAELSGAEREAFLARACAADGELLAEARELLAGALLEDGFLTPPRRPALDALLAPEVALPPGTRLGGFRLLRVLAQGGMGLIFEAEQEMPRRRVAVKVVRQGLGGTEGARRFRREAELLARLRHPGIAQVFASGMHVSSDAAGRSSEVPWYALELVEDALPLIAYAEHARLDLRARVKLLAAVADAVQHGHAKGVLHRDLKSDNVLVDTSGRPKVIDFGIARALGDDLDTDVTRTRAGELLGTPAAMSPEQVAGAVDQIDTRTDVWALGVLLFELLTGAPPFALAGRSVATVARAIQEDEPTRPRALNPALSADLELVTLKALEKDPARRHPSAAALRDDLTAWLGGQAVSARPATLAYQLRVLARRHRALATAAVLVTVATLGAAAISVHFGLRASRSATEAKLRATAEAEARAEADAEAERARRASELAAKRFDDVRGIARALLFDVYDAIAPLAGATAPRRVVADTALEYLTALEVDAGDDAGLLAELAEGWLRLGHVLGHPSLPSLGDRVGGEAASLRALAAAEHLEHVRPDSSTGAFLAVRARLQLGLFALAGGRAEDALAFFDRALAESARLSEGGALERDVLRLEGNALHLSSNALLALGRRDQAAERLDAAVERARSLLAVDPADDVVRRDLGMALLRRANLALESAQAAVAEPALEESLACFERIGASAVDNAQARADAAIALERLGDARLALGRWDDARAALERSVAVRTELVALDPADADALRRLSVGCERLGVLFQRKGEHVAAAEAHARALEHSRALLARFPADRSAQRSVAIGLQYRGECALALGRADEAERDFLEALAVQDELAAQAPEREALDLARDRIGSLSTLGDLALTRADAQTAFERYTRLDELARSAAAVDPQHAWTRRMALVAACDLGMARRGLGEQAERDADDRGAHLAAALEEIARGEALYVELERAGFLEPGDDQALEAMRADAAACRAALESLAP